MNVRYLSDVDAENVSKLLKANNGDIQATFLALGTLIPMNTIKRVKEKKLRPEISDKYFSKGDFTKSRDHEISQDLKIGFSDTEPAGDKSDDNNSKPTSTDVSGKGKRITEEDVLNIYKDREDGMSIKDIHKKYNLAEQTVRQIVTGRSHKTLYKKYHDNSLSTTPKKCTNTTTTTTTKSKGKNVIDALTDLIIESIKFASLAELTNILGDESISINDIILGSDKLRKILADNLRGNKLINRVANKKI